MYLSRLEIENYRGIRSAMIEFGESTVLIGENDSGKTTLLEAICLVLSVRQDSPAIVFRPSDFHQAQDKNAAGYAGAIRIRLTFRERRPDEWSFIRNNDIGLGLRDDVNKLQELTIDVASASAQKDNNTAAHWRIIVEGRYPGEYSGDLSILEWIRRLNPVFRIRSGLFVDLEGNKEYQETTGDSKRPGTGQAPNLSDKIWLYYKNLIEGTSQDANADLQAGYREALKNLRQASHLFSTDIPPLEQIIYDILGHRPVNSDSHLKKAYFHHGSAAEKIGFLLFTTAMLQSGGLMADPSAEPIIIIEDPEAHLHPMTLQSVKLMIERLRWQKILTTQSGDLLSDFPLQDIRRISRREGIVKQHRFKPGDLSREELRRLSYHVRMRLSTATFARCWLLVEGESEVWLIPHIARLCGHDLTMEGVVCVEFAQCGIAPLIKAANQLGIEWFLLADGDAAGKAYVETVRHFVRQAGESPDERSLRLREKDIEHHLFFNGYAGVYQEYSGIPQHIAQNMQPRRIIGRAIHRQSKPFMAVAVVEAMAREGSPGVPAQLKKLIETCTRLAKGAMI